LNICMLYIFAEAPNHHPAFSKMQSLVYLHNSYHLWHISHAFSTASSFFPIPFMLPHLLTARSPVTKRRQRLNYTHRESEPHAVGKNGAQTPLIDRQRIGLRRIGYGQASARLNTRLWRFGAAHNAPLMSYCGRGRGGRLLLEVRSARWLDGVGCGGGWEVLLLQGDCRRRIDMAGC
jgi:hypothetical protein